MTRRHEHASRWWGRLAIAVALLAFTFAVCVNGSMPSLAPAPIIIPESSLSCAPISADPGHDAHIQRVTLVSAHVHRDDEGHAKKKKKKKHDGDAPGTASFLFRGALPDRDGFMHKRLLREMRAAADAAASAHSNSTHSHGPSTVSAAAAAVASSVPFPSRDSDVYLIDVNLMWLSKESDAVHIESEYEWFTMRTDQHTRVHNDTRRKGVQVLHTDAPGEFHLWQTFGTHNNASDEYFDEPSGPESSSKSGSGRRHRHRKQVSHNSQLVEELRAGKVPRHWSVPDELDERVAALQHWLHHTRVTGTDGRARTVVIYVHCFCGVDRTGEMMGAWSLTHEQPPPSWTDVQRRNTAIGGRPVECRNYRALQWYCLLMEGQRKTKLGCMQNLQCSEFI